MLDLRGSDADNAGKMTTNPRKPDQRTEAQSFDFGDSTARIVISAR